MTQHTPPEYVQARCVLLGALQALGGHSEALILVGAQAVYLHTGETDLPVAPTTTDADIALAPDQLLDEPLLEKALHDAGFTSGTDPGSWRGRSNVAVDLIVPDALSGQGGRRGARLPTHGNRVARRSAGLEPAVIDNSSRELTAFDPNDQRRVTVRVAGIAALLTAKITKIEERRYQPHRQQPKDGLDVLRLLQVADIEQTAGRLVGLTHDDLAGPVTCTALASLHSQRDYPEGSVASLATQAAGILADAKTIRQSIAILIDELLTEYDKQVNQ